MPSKSPAQARLMAGVAHSPKFAKKVGISQAVGKEFNRADTGKSSVKLKAGDNRIGRLTDVKTDRGTFRIKSNRKGD